MTASVEVKARAWGAKAVVTKSGEETHFDVPANTSQEFHLDTGDTIQVTEGDEASGEANPNDVLIKPVDQSTMDQLSGNTTKPVDNMTGGTETTQTTDADGKPKMR